MLKKGDIAPEFKIKNTSGKIRTLKDFNKPIALYFYPKDDTPGCTKEACNLRDNYGQLQESGITIIGISPDNQESHKKFIAKHKFPFELLCDTNHEVSESYGVWVKKNLYGREYWGIKRTTFIINKKGKIQEIITDVDVMNHASQILNILKNK